MRRTQSLNNYKISENRSSMEMKTPDWDTKHTRIARKLEKHLEAPKLKVYTSYSKYMKTLHAKTS